jgi:hypothetical protein
VIKGVENNKSEWDFRKGDGVDNRHDLIDDRSLQLHCILLHKHTFKHEHWEIKTKTKGPKSHQCTSKCEH